uniref:Uncharacterized protein n=1 Tax=Aegilops tauschii subsp. strangulata TaxID=200361 RepID=A0A452ZAB2_AEGTS
CSPVYGKAADLSCEGGSDDRSKDTTPSNIAASKSDRLRMSPSSDRDKLGSIPENPTAEEEINKEEHPHLQKGLGKHMSVSNVSLFYKIRSHSFSLICTGRL